jgi:hypothetical protein
LRRLCRENAPSGGTRPAQTSRGLRRSETGPGDGLPDDPGGESHRLPGLGRLRTARRQPLGLLCLGRGAQSNRELTDAWLPEQIKKIHAEHRGVYGWRRIHAELRLAHDVRVPGQRVRRLMRHAGMSGLVRKNRGRTTIRIPVSASPTPRRAAAVPPGGAEGPVGRRHHLPAHLATIAPRRIRSRSRRHEDFPRLPTRRTRRTDEPASGVHETEENSEYARRAADRSCPAALITSKSTPKAQTHAAEQE